MLWSGWLLWFVEQQNDGPDQPNLSFWLLWSGSIVTILVITFVVAAIVLFLLVQNFPQEPEDLEALLDEHIIDGHQMHLLEDRLRQAVSDSKRSGRKYALILMRVDYHNPMTVDSGVVDADGLLESLANRLTDGLRDTDSVSVIEQNQFAVLLETEDRLIELVEKIYLKLIDPEQSLGFGRISAKLGVAQYPEQAITAENLYQYASEALQSAEAGTGPIVFYQGSDDYDVAGYTIIQSLRKAIDNDELKLVFQPVTELTTNRTVYLEALLRWKDPEKYDFSIERTIELAEKNRMIHPLTNWIVSKVCLLLSELKIEDMAIGVNFSMIDLHDHQLPQRIQQEMKKYRIKPNQIVIEITEGQIMQKPEEVVDILSRLGVMGLSISVDDFGTGQASLTYLKKLPIEKLKIDQSFVRDMVDDEDDQLIVKATIELAHTLDLKVIAEGVETAEIQGLLKDMNCDYQQGYFISRPLEVAQIEGWYDSIS